MPSRRYVAIPVDDPRVTHVIPEFRNANNKNRIVNMGQDLIVPVPPDDQLARHVEALCELAEANYLKAVDGEHKELLRPYRDGARYLRAVFQLGEEE